MAWQNEAMRVCLALVALSVVISVGLEAATKKTSKKRRTPQVAPVSAKVKAQAVSYVHGRVEAVSTIENAAALVPFFERLSRLEEKESEDSVHILHFGDSHTAADDWTGRMRDLFQARFGNGGSGFSLAGKPFRGYRRYGQRSTMTKGWTSMGLLQRDGDAMYGLGGVAIETSRPNETITLEGDAEAVELWYLRQPGGGTIQILEEGQPIETIPTDGPFRTSYYRFTPSSRVWQVSTTDAGPVRLFGWTAENAAGVTYEALGINGAQADIFGRWDEEMLAEQIARRDPALVVLAYGTNEASNRDWSYESYRREFSLLLQQVRAAAPAASILVVGPPDRQHRIRRVGWRTFPLMNEIVRAQRDAARENRCAFWDLRARMGGEGAMTRWVQAGFAARDHAHFSQGGYQLVGDVLHRDILSEYARYAEVRERVSDQTADGQTNDDR